MQSPYCFIATPRGDVRYDTIRESGLIVSSSKEDHKVTNRYAIVKSLPINYNGPIDIGDTLLVHHNTFRRYYDMKGKERNGPSYFKDGLFFIFEDQYFMYKKSGGKWTAPDPYCFIRPTKDKLIGTVAYNNKELESIGVMEGDVVSFQPESEYEFRLDGEILYRMFTRNICLIGI